MSVDFHIVNIVIDFFSIFIFLQPLVDHPYDVVMLRSEIDEKTYE